MASWSSLPPEMHHEIIKRMDFITRFRFRLVSKTSQYLVDSVPFYIPIIDFRNSELEKVIELDFYFGIPRYEGCVEYRVFLTFRDGDMGLTTITIKAHKYFKVKTVPSYDKIVVAARVLKHVAMHPRTLIGILCFSNGWGYFDRNLLEKVFKSRRFRAKTLQTGPYMSDMFVFCKPADLLEFRTYSKSMENRYGYLLSTHTKKLEYKTPPGSEPVYSFPILQSYRALDFGQIDDELDAQSIRGSEHFTIQEIGPNDYRTADITEKGKTYGRINSCGAFTRTLENEGVKVTIEDCEMRFLCVKHTDPLEFWFHDKLFGLREFRQNNPERITYRTIAEEINPKINGECGLTSYLNYCIEREAAKIGEEWEEDLIGELKHDHDFDVMEGVLQQLRIAKGRVEKEQKKREKWKKIAEEFCWLWCPQTRCEVVLHMWLLLYLGLLALWIYFVLRSVGF